MKGFYAGALPNMTRCLLKNSYRYPLMVGLPNFYKSKMPVSIQEHKSLLKFLTSVNIALVESIITCPVERLKVFFMTQAVENRVTYRQFFQNNQANLFKELFRGFGPLFMRQSMAWIVFLQTDLLVKKQIRRIMNIPEKS